MGREPVDLQSAFVVTRNFHAPFFGSISGALRRFSAAGGAILSLGFGFNCFLKSAGA